ncbi:MAG: hypothetical protein JWM72_1692 [Actinomycetia bacterium]|nr:hypothetical protein [Actinomycetes bacterium]MDQ1461860.1 hypothetical protein [Actinomycetota bacterium]
MFVASWALLGAVKARYSPIHDPISDLAAVHASTRVYMTAAFVVFAIGLTFYARALRSTLDGPAWIAALTTGVATLGVAAFPLDHSSTIDSVHGIFAGVGYATLAATALLSARPLLRLGRTAWAAAAAIAGGVSAIALALTLGGSFHGLLQRSGLTAGDIWVVTSAVAIRRRSWDETRELRAGPVSG